MSVKQIPGSSKKHKKEEKIKEIKKVCLLNANFDEDSLNKHKNFERIQYLAKEFISECKRNLDEKSFEILIVKLLTVGKNQVTDAQTLNETVKFLFDMVSKNKSLETRLSMFMSCENIASHDQFLNALQYQKVFDFYQILEIFITNKCTLKRLFQSIITTCSSNIQLNNDNDALKQCKHYQQQQIISEIKNKIKSSTKNNPLINYELDYVFDQCLTNMQVQHEKVSLVGIKQINDETSNINDSSPAYEYIDLKSDSASQPGDYGTKKCKCFCHIVPDNEDYASANPINHCFLCSLKLIKGKLYIKCEGKKAIPLYYRTSTCVSHDFSTDN